MLRGLVENPADLSPTELRSAYEDALVATIESDGLETVADASGVDRAALAALHDGESPELTVEDAAAILAVDEERPAADAIAAEARDILLLGMTNAVLDVERLAADLGGDFDPKELQQKIEGRAPMTLREYALVQGYLAGATD